MPHDKFNLNKMHDRLKAATNMVNSPMFSPHHTEEFKIQIRADNSVSPGLFKPDPLIPGGHKAHSTTIRALRKDIFVAGADEFIDLEDLIICDSCKTEVDKQFWFFCPFCEAKFRDS